MKEYDFDIPVEVAGVRFRNPFYVASGPTAMRIEQLREIQETGWGGASLKLTLDPPPYINRRPRYGYYKDQNFLSFTAEKRLTMDKLLHLIEQGRKETPELVLFSNITYSGDKGVEGWVNMAKQCESAGVHINELNMCCPNMSFNVEMSGKDEGGPKTGASLGQNREAIQSIVQGIKQETSIPLFVKITPEGGGQGEVAQAALEAGADAVGSNANRLAIPPVDLDNPTRSMYHLQKEIGMACMNSRWLLPLGKRDVYQIRRKVGPDYTLTACGGVTEWRDGVEMAMCGADLVGICAATLVYGYGFMPEFIRGVQDFMKEKGYRSFRDMRDILVPAVTSAPDLTIYEGHAVKKDENLSAPCRAECPMQLPIQGILARVAEKRFKEAYDLIVRSGPFQEICSRICDHPCESVCIRGDIDEPLNIMGIKRFVMDLAEKEGWEPEPEVRKTDSPRGKVAVAGSGPAGFSAGYHLARAGYDVTVFEKNTLPGGTVQELLPGFRKQARWLEREIELAETRGVTFVTNTEIGRDITVEELKQQGFDALFIGTGSARGIIPDVPGADKNGVFSGTDFLREPGSADNERIAVIGGGFTAIDAVRTAVRQGAEEVFIVYRRTREEMPASEEEVMEAEEEGVRIIYLAQPIEICGSSRVESLRVSVNTLGQEDTSGRRTPVSVQGSEFTLAVDTVIFAISQVPDPDTAALFGVQTDKNGFVTTSERACTSDKMIYAGGDCVTGPQNIISAVRAGYDAAVEIDRNIAGEDAFLQEKPELTKVDREMIIAQEGNKKRQLRISTKNRDPQQRRSDNSDTVLTLTEDEAVKEASRCMACGCGAGCEVCSDICTVFAWSVENGRTVLDPDACVGCGMCIWRCPKNNIDMQQTSDEPV